MDNQNTIRYPYSDENGHTLFTKVRVQEKDGTKNFYFEREDDNGNIVKNITGCRKVLYRLPDLVEGIAYKELIFLVEGEKDVGTLLGYNLIATTAHISVLWFEEYTETLKHADVIILYDNDKTGLERKNLLCSALYDNVKRLRVVDLPGLEYREKHGLDITDWLGMGNTIEHLLDLVDNTPDYKPIVVPASVIESEKSQKSSRLNLISIDGLFSLQLPPREMLLSPFLPTQALVLLVAKRGVGKTYVGLRLDTLLRQEELFCDGMRLHQKEYYMWTGKCQRCSCKRDCRKLLLWLTNAMKTDFLICLHLTCRMKLCQTFPTKKVAMPLNHSSKIATW